MKASRTVALFRILKWFALNARHFENLRDNLIFSTVDSISLKVNVCYGSSLSSKIVDDGKYVGKM